MVSIWAWLRRRRINFLPTTKSVSLPMDTDASQRYLLVDYENVDVVHRNRGIQHIIEYTINLLGSTAFCSADRVVVRLYGGWFLGSDLSVVAQDLVTELDACFPRPVYLQPYHERRPILVRAELARSLLIDPPFDLFFTYRKRGFPRGIKCYRVPFEGCTDSNACPLGIIPQFFSRASCHATDCRVAPKDVLFRAEQKLVDTMLTSDLITLAHEGATAIAVTSNDDDLWPGIRTACHLGTHIYHVHPLRGGRTRDRYTEPIRDLYNQFFLFELNVWILTNSSAF